MTHRRNGAASAETQGSRLSWLADKTLKWTWMAEHRGKVLEGTVELRFLLLFSDAS